MPSRIHLIENLGLMQRVNGDIFDSGYWKITPQQAGELTDCDIYFHKKQKEPSFFGGKILSFRIFDEDDELRGRIIFRFKYSRSHKGVSAGEGGWSYEKKIV